MKLVIIPVYRSRITELNFNENIILPEVAYQFWIMIKQWLELPGEFVEFGFKGFIVGRLVLKVFAVNRQREIRPPLNGFNAGMNFFYFGEWL